MNVGSRLTAYELVQEGLPATLIADSAAAALMAAGRVDAIVVGADRIAANGDTANKIGTYSLAVNAAQHRCSKHTFHNAAHCGCSCQRMYTVGSDLHSSTLKY